MPQDLRLQTLLNLQFHAITCPRCRHDQVTRAQNKTQVLEARTAPPPTTSLSALICLPLRRCVPPSESLSPWEAMPGGCTRPTRASMCRCTYICVTHMYMCVYIYIYIYGTHPIDLGFCCASCSETNSFHEFGSKNLGNHW